MNQRRLLVWLSVALLLLLLFCLPRLVPAARFILAFETLERNSQGLLEYRHRKTGIVFVRIPWDAGDYLLAKREVTQRQWTAVMGSNPATFRPNGANSHLLRIGEDCEALPVDSVSWYECQEFCERTGLMFPTEAQWENACRAGTTTSYSFGEEITREHAMFQEKIAYREGDPLPRVVRMDHFPANPYGLQNMHGNLFEWCFDRFGDPADGKRVVRGGSWTSAAEASKCGFRWGTFPDRKKEFFGFRPAFHPLP